VESLTLGSRQISLLIVKNPRARRYLLRLRPDGTARVTIPRGGTQTEARRFVERNVNWLEEQFKRQASRPSIQPANWQIGSEILFRGELVRLESPSAGEVGFCGEILKVDRSATDLRPMVELHLRRLATQELPARLMELAGTHGLKVQRVSIRNQKSRWGSCSRRGTISLNWRLIQTPETVRDYICLHELAHLRHMNHSTRFWQEVERLCPNYRESEKWLKSHRGFIR